jgi:adenylate cyclase
MGREIERKFLVKNDTWRMAADRKQQVIQGYLANNERCSVRVRLSGDSGYLNIKSMKIGVSRAEYEYTIPAAEAREILYTLCAPGLIEKTRHYVAQGPHVWEIDVFEGVNQGLVVAEIELSAEDEIFEHPVWLGEEVTDDSRYYNVCLAQAPYNTW